MSAALLEKDSWKIELAIGRAIRSHFGSRRGLGEAAGAGGGGMAGAAQPLGEV